MGGILKSWNRVRVSRVGLGLGSDSDLESGSGRIRVLT